MVIAADLPRLPRSYFSFLPASKTMYRFWQKVEINQETGCWDWTASKTGPGYGQISNGFGKPVLAHRVAYQHYVGPIPKGLVLDHLCRNRGCVNPAHLEAVTQRENLLRGNTLIARQVQQTHCVRGHEFTPENTRLYRGERHCRACSRRHSMRRRRRDAR